MAIDFTEAVFPNNVVILMADRYEEIDDTLTVLRRPLRISDPNFTLGVFSTTWTPEQNTGQIMGVDFSREFMLEQYIIRTQILVRNSDEEDGLTQQSVLAELVRSILVDDIAFRQQLGGLTATITNTTKRLQRWWTRNGTYLSGEVKGQNLYLSTLDTMIEVEKV